MSPYKADIAILGGGVLGASIFHALSDTNRVLIDDGELTSASKQSLGLFRALHENASHTQLALEHYALMFPTFSSTLQQSGSLYLFHQNRLPDYQASLNLLEKNQYPFECLTAKEASVRFPMLHFNHHEYVLYEPYGGKINTSCFLPALKNGNQQHIMNGYIHTIICLKDYFILHADAFTIECQQLILAGGYRLLPQLANLGIQLPLTIKPISLYQRKLTTHLAIPHYFDRETLEFAAIDEECYLSSGTTKPSRIIPNLSAQTVTKYTAYDCYAPLRCGYLGALSHLPRLYLATGWGGTAFKFSLAIGQSMARLLANKRNSYTNA